ncbi:MAG: ATP-binding cassette domain-containing protein [Bacteroidetes bacterium]|nr:ATP-binding cassette domain-containing protein [Bacteroidota bacterium]
MLSVLTIDELNKYYGRIHAVNKLSLSVPKGSVYGILGPNGSGKTTTLGIVLGIIHSTGGSFNWFGEGNNDANRKRIGALLEQPIFYPYLSGEQNLKLAAKIKGAPKSDIDRVLNLVELETRKRSSAKTYSLGMKQRLAIGSAMLGDPEVLVLDEPTNGLDPQGIAEMRELIKKIASSGKTIILASHLLDEVEKVCTHVAVIKNGVLLAEGGVNEIVHNAIQIEIAGSDMERIETLLKGFAGIQQIIRQGNVWLVTLNEELNPASINTHLVQSGISIYHFAQRKKRLEEQFLELTANKV